MASEDLFLRSDTEKGETSPDLRLRSEADKESSSSSSSSISISSSSSSSSLSISSSSSSSSSSSLSSSSSSVSSSSSSSSLSSSSSCSNDPEIDYTRGDYEVLPLNDANLETSFTCPEYYDVQIDDNIYVSQLANNENVIFLFKRQNDNNTDNITIDWIGKTDLSPITSTVYLQIYNQDLASWETKDSDNTTLADIEFILTSTISINVEDYYDVSYWVAWRVYQGV